MRYVLPLLLTSCLLLTGCYQARMTTGKEPSDVVVRNKWTPSFLYGLIPAKVDVSDECPNGIASAERKLSFLNMVVGGLTFSLFTPQSVTVTCAAKESMSATLPASPNFTLPRDATRAEIQEVPSSAALQSSIVQPPVRVRGPK